MKSFRVVGIVIFIAAISSCGMLGDLYDLALNDMKPPEGEPMSETWYGTADDYVYEATYNISVTITIEKGTISGTGTFQFDEVYLTDLPVTGSVDTGGTGNVDFTIYGVDGGDMVFSGYFEGDGSAISGTWWATGEGGDGYFYLARESEEPVLEV